MFLSLQTGRLPSGDETQAGARITISGVSRQMAGVYECVPDNGVGAPAVGRVSLQVHCKFSALRQQPAATIIYFTTRHHIN